MNKSGKTLQARSFYNENFPDAIAKFRKVNRLSQQAANFRGSYRRKFLEEVGNTVQQGADPVYLNQFYPDSLRPDPVRHSAHIVLQTDTGIPLEIAMRLQIILQVKGLSHVACTLGA
jgi:hypothetical protein